MNIYLLKTATTKLLTCVLAGITVSFFTSCAEDVDEKSSPSTQLEDGISFKIDLSQHWNERNAQPRNQATMARESYGVEADGTIDGKACRLRAMTINGIVAPAERHTETAAATRGTLINTTDEFYNEMGLMGYHYTGTDIGTSNYLYDTKLTRSGDLWSAGRELWWPGDKVRFYAYVPYHGEGITLSAKTVAGPPHLKYVSPQRVTDQKDLMMATSADLTAAPETPIPMTFDHLLASVRFRVGTPIAKGTIKKITLEGIRYKGEYDRSTDSWTLEDDLRTFSVDTDTDTEGNTDVVVNGGENTFLIIPQTLGDEAKATIDIEYDDSRGNRQTAQVSAPLAGLTWKKGTTTTYAITTGELTFDYVFEVSPENLEYTLAGETKNYTVTSYKENSNGSRTPVAWHVTGYSLDGGQTWEDAPSWLALDATEGGADMVEDGHTGKADERDQATEFSLRKPVADYDLSTHDFMGNESKMNTANCYIVNRPGSYKLPLVYGNAIKNGADNKVAYHPGSDSRYPNLYSATNHMPQFLNHLDNPITDPYIRNNTGCVPSGGEIIWQDVENLVSNVRVDGNYLRFDMDASSIKGGNSIIAVTDAEGTVMWSWHIWVTDRCTYKTHESYLKDSYYGYSTYLQPSGNITQEVDFSKEQLLLGYLGQSATEIEERMVLVRYEQEESGETDEVVFSQEGLHYTIPEFEGRPTYYQWGRKDPMLPLNDEGTANRTMYNASRPFKTANIGSEELPVASLGTSIQKPDVFFCASDKGNGWRNNHANNNRMSNLWNGIGRKFGTNKSDSNYESVGWAGNTAFEKTIYDPCPVGFHVPDPVMLFFQGHYTNQAAGRGLLLYLLVNGAYNGTIFKASGYRFGTTGNVVSAASAYAWPNIIAHEEDNVTIDIQRNAPFTWQNSSDTWYKWGAYVFTFEDYGSSCGAPVIAVKDKEFPEGWPRQPE